MARQPAWYRLASSVHSGLQVLDPAVNQRLTLLLAAVVVLTACRKETATEETPVPVDPGTPTGTGVRFEPAQVPYPVLSTYRFFAGSMKEQAPNAGVLPYEPITALFSDYAHKFRFVWMPPGVKASYAGDHDVLDFPESSVLIKTFYYDNVLPDQDRRIIETRLLFKRSGSWYFADYVWNEEQTEAYLDMNGSITPVTFVDDGGTQRTVQYRIPSAAECQTCHKIQFDPIPIGPKPQNLNSSYSYADGVKNQLDKWVEMGYLQPGYPSNIMTTVKWDDATQPLDLRVRSYLDMNCAHCHADQRHCNYRPMRFAFHESADLVNLGVCVEPDDPVAPQYTQIVARGNPNRSMMHFRLAETDETVRMPLLGRTVVHDEGLALVREWIENLPGTCP
jgi:uncharacterized repeat protein (TIGR03806 family)